MQFKDYYSTLGVDSSASQTEIKKAFHKKAMEYHPDRNAGFKEESEKKMKEINEAYSALFDSDKRRMYDYEYYESK
jgi:DnaJ-class molecular chaperone